MGISPTGIITAICPELAGSPSLQVFLGMAADSVSPGFFGASYNQAVAYKAAHLYALFAGDKGTTVDSINKIGGGAPVSSLSEGGVSVSFAVGADNGSDLNSTKYGRMLQGLIKSRPRVFVNQEGG